MNQLAEELNGGLAGTVAERLLSEMGRHMYFPKGIITQGAEASEHAHRFNATIGMAYEHGQPMMLDALRRELPGLTPTRPSPMPRLPESRTQKDMERGALQEKSLAGQEGRLPPVVVPGLTAAVSYICDLFVEPGDTVIVPICTAELQAHHRGAEDGRGHHLSALFRGRYNVDALLGGVRQAGQRRGKAIIILNFPNNPTGYSLTLEEADRITAGLLEIAREGTDILAITDEPILACSMKTISSASPCSPGSPACIRTSSRSRPTAPQKKTMCGVSDGFVTFGGGDLTDQQYDALTKKLAGIIRSSVSSSCSLSQNLLLKALAYEGYDAQKAVSRHSRGALQGDEEKAGGHGAAQGAHADTLQFGLFHEFLLRRLFCRGLRKKLLYEMA